MKQTTKTGIILLGSLLAAPLALAAPPATDGGGGGGKAEATATAEATAEASGSKSSHKQTVTVTSDGTCTIRKTVTVRDGVEETVTEITGPDGKTTTTREKGGAPQDQAAAKTDKPWLGVRAKEAPDVLRDQLQLAPDEGMVIDLVAPDSPAAKAQLQANDILLKLADTKLATPDGLRAEIQRHAVGDTVPLEFLRKGERQTIDVTLDAAPADARQEGEPPAAAELLENARARHQAGPGKIKVEIDSDFHDLDMGGGLDAVLDNPNVPEEFKKTVREMIERMEESRPKPAVD